MIHYRPILVDHRKEAIHQVGHFLKVRRRVIANIDGVFAVPATKLSDVCDGCVI